MTDDMLIKTLEFEVFNEETGIVANYGKQLKNEKQQVKYNRFIESKYYPLT